MSHWNLKICTYNVMLTAPVPFRCNGQYERAKRIPNTLVNWDPTIDVFVFVELMNPSTRRIVLDQMTILGWSHHSYSLRKNPFFGPLKLTNGGVVIVSRYPILYQKNHIFDQTCEGYDCHACKGAVFCRIQKEANIFNILGTHFQAWDTPGARIIRLQQAQQCYDLIDSINIPSDEPVILAGDLNIDFYSRRSEVSVLCDRLKIRLLERQKNSHEFTSDPSTNQLMGNDEDIMYATDVYPDGCYKEYMETMFCPCCPREWLDYIGYSHEHLIPDWSEMYVGLLKTDTSFLANVNITSKRQLVDLSDHYPLIGLFRFDVGSAFSGRQICTTHHGQRVVSSFWYYIFVLIGTVTGAWINSKIVMPVVRIGTVVIGVGIVLILLLFKYGQ